MPEPQPFKLIIEDDEGRRSVVPVDLGDVTLGRHEENVIRLKERNVSRRHARLLAEADGRIFAYDLDSYNGLWANGDRITGRFELHQGDILRIGDFQLELKGDGLKPRREETTQRTRVQDVDGAAQEAEEVATEPTDVEVVPPPPEAPGQKPPDPVDNHEMSHEPTVTEVAPAAVNQPLSEIMNEATALIRSPIGEVEAGQNSDLLLPPYAKLLCLTTAFVGQEFTLQQAETVVGRTDDNEIAIDHRSISRHHAKIVYSGGRYRVVDLDSANGTLVNGELYAQAELKRGDVIELGHVRLRFVPPGESVYWTVDEQNLLQRMEARRRHRGRFLRNTPVVMLLLVGSAMVGLGLACYIAYGPKILRVAGNFANQTSHANNPAAADAAAAASLATANREEVERMLFQARHAVGARQWKRAEGLATSVLSLEPSRDEAQAIVRQCGLESKSQAAFETAVTAHGQRHWADAYNALQDVSHDSSVSRSANSLMAQVRPALLDERLADCAAAIHQEDWDEAELLIEEIAGLDGNRPELVDLRAAVKDGRAKHPSSTHAGSNTRKAAGHKDAPKATAPSRPTSAPTGTPAVPVPPTSTQTAGGAPTSASTSSRPTPGKDPKPMYAEGTRLLAAKQYGRAIDEFQRCVAADKNFAMCYRALGIAYADSNNGPEAVRYYRLYLKVDPTARDAAQVRQLLQQYDASQPSGAQADSP